MPKVVCTYTNSDGTRCGALIEVLQKKKHIEEHHPELLEGIEDEKEIKKIIDQTFVKQSEAAKISKGEEKETIKGDEEEIDASLPPGDWFVKFLERFIKKPWDLKFSTEELDYFRETYNAQELLPNAVQVETWLVNGGFCKAEKARRIAMIYHHLAQRYISKKASMDRRFDLPGGGPMVAEEKHTPTGIYPPLFQPQSATPRPPTQPFMMPQKPPVNFMTSGQEGSSPTVEEIVRGLVPVIDRRMLPLIRRLDNLERVGLEDGAEVDYEEGEGKELGIPVRKTPGRRLRAPENPVVEGLRKELLEQGEQVKKLLGKMDAEDKRREEERKEKEFLDKVDKTVETRIGPLMAELQNLKREGAFTGTPEQYLALYGRRREADLDEDRFKFDRTKWLEEFKADRDFKTNIAEAVGGFGDFLGEVVGNTVSKNLRRRGVSGKGEQYAVQGKAGENVITVPCPECGKPIFADKDAKVITCMTCGVSYEVGPPPRQPPQQPQQPGPAPEGEQGNEEEEGKIRIVDRDSGEPVKFGDKDKDIRLPDI